MKREQHIPLTVVIPIKDRNGTVIGEKEVASYAGLLAKAHEEGLKAITTVLRQPPTKENGMVAIAEATVETQRGQFTGIGDANPGNVNARIAPHLIRMAETRAKARALRDAVNIGVVALEELGDDVGDDVLSERTEALRPVDRDAGDGDRRPATPAHAADSDDRRRRPSGDGGGNGAGNARPRPTGSAGPGPITESQRRYLFRLASDLGMEGDAARDYLLDALGVDDLRRASKSSASVLIDRMRSESMGGDGYAPHGGPSNGAAAP